MYDNPPPVTKKIQECLLKNIIKKTVLDKATDLLSPYFTNNFFQSDFNGYSNF